MQRSPSLSLRRAKLRSAANCKMHALSVLENAYLLVVTLVIADGMRGHNGPSISISWLHVVGGRSKKTPVFLHGQSAKITLPFLLTALPKKTPIHQDGLAPLLLLALFFGMLETLRIAPRYYFGRQIRFRIRSSGSVRLN